MDDTKSAKFHVGQIVRHRLFDYRGVVFNVDPVFSGEPQWYDQVAQSRPPKNAPWYHVLPSGAEHTTYVAERNLERDVSIEGIVHPLIDALFDDFSNGRYNTKTTMN